MANKEKSAHDLFDESEDPQDEVSNTFSSGAQEPTPVDDRPIQERLLEDVGAGAAGAVQGITLGNADEILGGLQSVTSDVPYEQARDRLRDYYEGVKKQNPSPTMLGEFIGSMGIPAGPLVRSVKGASALPKVAAEIGESVALSGTAGLGYSEAPLLQQGIDEQIATNPLDRINPEVKTASALGALIPAGLRSIQGIAQGTGQIASGLPGINKAVEAFKEGRKGYKVFDKNLTEHKTIVAMQNMANTVADKIGEEGSKLPALVKQATQDGKTIDLSKIDEALETIQQLKLQRTTNKVASKDLDVLESALTDFRSGKEVTSTIPGRTEVVRGEYIPSGEEVVSKQLKDKSAVLQASDMAGAPEDIAAQKLTDRATKRELLSGEDVAPFETTPVTAESTGQEALAIISPETFQPVDAEIVRKMAPGEVRTFDVNGQKVMGIKLPSGKFYGKVVPERAASTKISYKDIPDETVTERMLPTNSNKPAGVTGQSAKLSTPNASPEDAYEMRKSLRNLLYSPGGEPAIKDPNARQIVQNIMNHLDEGLEGAAPGFENQLHNVAVLKSAIEDAGLVAKGKTKSKQVQGTGKKLFNEAAKTTGDSAASAEARFDVRKFFKSLKEVDPELAAKLEPKFKEQTNRYGLAAGVRDVPLQTATPRGLMGSLSSLAAKGGGMAGYGVRKIDNMVNKLVGKGTIAEPLITTLKKLTDENLSVVSRNALIFKISQDPSSRELLRSIENGEEDLANEIED